MSVTASEAPALHFSFLDPDFNRDPYPMLERVRETGPVVYNELFPDGWMCTGYRTCARILVNAKKFRQPAEFFVEKFGDVIFEALDTPRHDEIRAVWADEFKRDTLQAKRRQMIADAVDECLDPFIDRVLSGETVDAVSELHRVIPSLVIAEMMGLDRADRHDWAIWVAAIPQVDEGLADPTPRGAQLREKSAEGTAALNKYIADVLEARKGREGTDLMSMMATSEPAKTMTPGELAANNAQLVFAGNETTAKLMSHSVVTLARHPDQRRAIAEDRSLLPQAIEEIHRYQTIAQVAAPRIVVDGDAEIEGVRVPEGKRLVLLLGAANRDPERWDRPSEFDIFREPKQHLGFGFGMHGCLGMNLARLEVETYLNRLLDRLPDWEIGGEADYGVRFFGRGPTSLPIVKG